MLKELIKKNRSYRRFYQNEKIGKDVLLELIDLARLSSSGKNIQALKYILSYSEETNEKVFKNLKWAGYLKDWDGPIDGEKPSAYIIMLLDLELTNYCYWDHGIAAQSILLGATELNIGGCMFGAIDKVNLAKDFDIDPRYEIKMVIALGKPKENVILDEIGENGGIKYWRDDDKTHHVPKRKLEDLILDNK
ncbi:MAG: nitroreductase family protein [Clostridiales bacterium]|nr:nitroreductase family protein [Clostridiales bacterium]